MDAKRERELLALVPAAARSALRARDSTRANERLRAADIALTAVGFPAQREGIPLPEDLTPAQRAVAELLAPHNVYLGKWGMSSKSWARMRWLGLAPGGVLERVVPFVDGKRKRVPFWRALTVLSKRGEKDEDAVPDYRELHAFVRSLKLSPLERLDLFVDDALNAYYEIGTLEQLPESAFDKAAGPWAVQQADRLVTLLANRGRANPDFVKPDLAMMLLLAIVRAGIPVDPRWDVLIRPRNGTTPVALEILRAIPEPRRGTALARGAATVGFLAKFPSATLTRAILALAGPDGNYTNQEILKDLAPIAKKHAVVRDVVDAFRGKQPPPLVLTQKSEIEPQSIKELTKLQRLQLSAMLVVYDGEKRSLEKRFGDNPRGLAEQAFRIRPIVDARGKLAYEAFSWLADDGCVFKAGTTQMVAHLIQHGIDQCDDPRLEAALDGALAVRGPARADHRAHAWVR